ncbi:kinase-like protein [Gonapodya prolifera JEL478]|uniref:Kinase-like protein n=1 Tax=Gonapodya prolifera (strain JEL478) TaxID=1344416 RepID=A0A139A2R6_GONPJ|nr:kinase-like protein [Gonapodya prolifera JEL478]|eukprot:KXS11041.1 kinase-like protein [Gonapodya prolifera JEL478]
MVEVKETLDATYTETDDGDRTLNDYSLTNILGSGSFGVVYLGINSKTGAKYAIKEFSKTRLRKKDMFSRQAFGFRGRGRGRGRGIGGPPQPPPSAIEYIRGEVAILKKLNHPNIIKLYEVLDDPRQDSLYMVMELCEKGVVMDVGLDKTCDPYSEDAARKLFCQAVLGIEYLHEHEISHRDIKPDNLLLTSDDVLKIVDFGVSEMFVASGNDRSKKSAGSPAFFAPEMCVAHHGEMSMKACDVWALGVTLHCLVFGKLPFVAVSILELYEVIRTAVPEIPKTASRELRNLIEQMLEKDPEKRISIAGIKTHHWLTQDGKQTLPSTHENTDSIGTRITHVTEDEM